MSDITYNHERNNKSRLNQLDGLRIFMIGFVVLAHFEFLQEYSYGNFYYTYVRNATLAVDYFFMLSGFGILYGHINKDEKKATVKGSIIFAINKIKNIYPLYVFSLVVSVPYILFSRRHVNLVDNIECTAKEFAICLTLLQSGTLTQSLSHAINGVSWFLSTLFICYMICPIAVNHILKRLKNIVRCILYLGVIIGIVSVLTYFFTDLDGRFFVRGRIIDDLAKGSPYIRCWYVIIGMVIARIEVFLKYRINVSRKTGTIMEIICVSVALLWTIFRNSFDFVVGKRPVDIIICGTLLLIISLGYGEVSDFLARPRLAKIGRNSMYIFLLHYPIRHYVDFILFRNVYFGEITGIVMVIIIVILSVVVSFATYKVFNKLKHVKTAN